MTLIDSDRVRAALEAEWTNECARLRAPNACAVCRAYDNAIRTVQAIRDNPLTEEAS